MRPVKNTSEMIHANNLAELFEAACSTYANGKMSFLYGSDKSYTYEEFGKKTREIAAFLSSRGIGKGEKVAVYSQGHPNWAVAFFSATAFGRIAVPTLPDFSGNEVDNVIRHSEARVLFGSTKCLSKVLPQTMELLDLVINIETFECVKDCGEKASWDNETATPRKDDLATIIYTSGTTGKAKGVMLSHINFITNLTAGEDIFPIGTDDIFLSVLPLAHAYELSLGMLYPFASGSSVYYLQKAPTPSLLQGALAHVRPTAMLIVPLLIEKIYKSAVLGAISKSGMLRFLDKHFHKLSCRLIGLKVMKKFGGRLKFVGIGGAKLDPKVEAFLFNARFPYTIGYGLTETAPLLSFAMMKQTRVGSIGIPVLGVKLKLHNYNPETKEGEIVAKGDNVFPGYYKDPERTAAAFTEDGWFRTGDLACMDRDGRYYIRGRIGNMILGASGENIYPEEIENVFMENTAIEDVIVLKRPNGLTALVKLADGAASDIEKFRTEIRSYVNARVNASSQIAKVEFMTVPFEKTEPLRYAASSTPNQRLPSRISSIYP